MWIKPLLDNMQQPFPFHQHLQLVAYFCWIPLLAISTESAPLGKDFVLFNYLLVIWGDRVHVYFKLR